MFFYFFISFLLFRFVLFNMFFVLYVYLFSPTIEAAVISVL